MSETPAIRSRCFGLGVVLILVSAAVLRAVNLDWGLPDVFEEATPVRQAVGFWGQPGGAIDLNPHFFKYPSFTFYLNFLLQAVWYLWLSVAGGVRSLNEFRQLLDLDLGRAVLIGRGLQVALGALVVVPTALLARRLAGPVAGWVAGAIVAVLPLAVTESQLVNPDVALTLFVAAGLAACTALSDRGRRSDYLWAGVWLGLAAASKYPGALLAAALLVAHVRRVRVDGGGPGALAASSLLWQSLFTGAVVFALATPYVLLDASTALADIGFERRHMALGHLGREEGRAWSYYLLQAIPGGWTPWVAAAALAGVAVLLGRSSTRGRTAPGAVHAAVMLVVLGSWKMGAARYALPLVPVAAAWAGAAVAALAGLRLRAPVAARTLAAVVAVTVVAAPLVRTLGVVGSRGAQDSRRAAEAWIEAHVPAGSAVLVERYGPEPDGDRYHVLHLPFHGVDPHRYDSAYSAPFYATFDVVVFSSEVSGRYLANPREYPAQAAFYANMEKGFEEAARFPAGEYLGPTVRVLVRREAPAIRELSGIPPAFFLALRGNGPLAEYFSALGTTLVKQGRDDLGFRMLQEAVDMAPGSPAVWGNLGLMRLDQGRFEDAYSALREAAKLEPDNARVQYNLGVLYERMGELSQAADAYRRALALAPGLEEVYVGLGRALIADGRYAEARLVLNEFLLRFPRSSRGPAVEEALRELRRMGPGRP